MARDIRPNHQGNVLIFVAELFRHEAGSIVSYSIDASEAGIPVGGPYPHSITVPELNSTGQGTFYFAGFDSNFTATYRQPAGAGGVKLSVWND